MASGRLAGMAVRPFPRQSTMLLLQVHMAGQEPPPVLHGCRLEDSWWPGEKRGGEKKLHERWTRRSVRISSSYRCVSTGGWGWFKSQQRDFQQDYRQRLFAGGFARWHGAALALKWSSNTVIGPLCSLWKVNCKWTRSLRGFDIERKEMKHPSLDFIVKAVHPWESMGKKVGYLLKECHREEEKDVNNGVGGGEGGGGGDWWPPNNIHWSRCKFSSWVCVPWAELMPFCTFSFTTPPHLFTSICSKTFSTFQFAYRARNPSHCL